MNLCHAVSCHLFLLSHGFCGVVPLAISPLDSSCPAVKFIHHFTTKKHGENMGKPSIAAYHMKQNGLKRMDVSKT